VVDAGSPAVYSVTDVRKENGVVWHTISATPPAIGTTLRAELDWDRRHRLMRTHTALHVLCGVIWNEWHVPVTGGNMEPLSARMDFEFDPLPDGFAARVEQLVNDVIVRDLPIEVSFLPRETAVLDADLIRTKVSLVPETVREVRVVDIVGLDKQADGGTHVRSTREIGTFRIVKTESKGRGNKRLRIEIDS
jgi:misacylated tRNA(Ala) deacylase